MIWFIRIYDLFYSSDCTWIITRIQFTFVGIIKKLPFVAHKSSYVLLRGLTTADMSDFVWPNRFYTYACQTLSIYSLPLGLLHDLLLPDERILFYSPLINSQNNEIRITWMLHVWMSRLSDYSHMHVSYTVVCISIIY